MPRVLGYTPRWLSRPAPGFQVFQTKPKAKASQTLPSANTPAKDHEQNRTLAQRGSEIFAVVGNELRWSDLVMLKEIEEDGSSGLSSRGGSVRGQSEDHGYYRVLKVPVTGQITHISISPYSDYMAIITKHTVHIAILPDPNHLNSGEWEPLKPKTFQLGPTAHVLEQSPIASALWHPLGVDGHCLVTITTDAIVRLWEVNRDDRSSFNEPTLAVDLKKLANATSANEDMGPTGYGKSKGFTPDSFELEVSAACFGGSDEVGVHGWAPMTLWLATKGGDVYAMCPLLPSRWQLNRWSVESPIMRSISTAIAAETQFQGGSEDTTSEERQILKHQQKWLHEIKINEPLVTTGPEQVEIHGRPLSVPAIPKLQGPFQLTPYPEDELELTDIYVTGLKCSDPDLEDEDDYEQITKQEGLAAAVIVLVSQDCVIRTCLDLDGVNAQWLPPKPNVGNFSVEDNYRDLLLLEEKKLLKDKNYTNRVPPKFTLDVYSENKLFITHDHGVHYISMSSWVESLETELNAMDDEGASFRLELFLDGVDTLVQEVISFDIASSEVSTEVSKFAGPPSCIVLNDSDLGYFLLTSLEDRPYAIAMDPPHDLDDLAPPGKILDLDGYFPTQTREVYQPPKIFWQESQLPAIMAKRVPPRHQRLLQEEIKLSPAILQLMTEAHRIISHETYQLGVAVADLFRRCDRLRDEFADQLKRVRELTHRIDVVTGDDEFPSSGDEDEDPELVGAAKIEKRLDNVKLRNEELAERMEKLRKRVGRVGTHELSDKEKGWMAEVDKLNESVNKPSYANTVANGNEDEAIAKPAWKRIEEIEHLKDELTPQVTELVQDLEGAQNNTPEKVRMINTFKKQKVSKVMELLDRETALVEATSERLSKLNLKGL